MELRPLNGNQYDKAIESYNKAIKLDGDYAIAINNRGMAYFSKGELDKAKADFDKFVEEHDEQD